MHQYIYLLSRPIGLFQFSQLADLAGTLLNVL
jgi:hypothetical protein